MIVSTAALCLAINVYAEARSETIPGQYAVALVTMNRAKHDRSKVCQEVFKAKQFSWANNGTIKIKDGWQIAHYLQPHDVEAWNKAQIIANITLAGRMYDITEGSTFYHTLQVNPAWNVAMVKTKIVGRHVFYRLT